MPTDVIKIITNYVGVNTNFKHEYVLCHIRGQSRVIADIIINNINHKIYVQITKYLNQLLTHQYDTISRDARLLYQVYMMSKDFQEIESVNSFTAKLKNMIQQLHKNCFIFRYDAIKWVHGIQHPDFVPIIYKHNPYKSIIEVDLYDILIKL